MTSMGTGCWLWQQWLVMGMMERLAIQWAVLILSHSWLINEPSSHPHYCSHPYFSPYHSDGPYLCSDTAHAHLFPYWLTPSCFSLSCLSFLCAHVVCVQCPALNLFLYIVVAYCLYFPQILSTQDSPSLTRTPLTVS